MVSPKRWWRSVGAPGWIAIYLTGLAFSGLGLPYDLGLPHDGLTLPAVANAHVNASHEIRRSLDPTSPSRLLSAILPPTHESSSGNNFSPFQPLLPFHHLNSVALAAAKISPTTWNETEEGLRWQAPRPLANGERHESPDITVDGHGAIWATWIGFQRGGEHVFLRRQDPNTGAWGKPIQVTSGEAIRGWPRLAAAGPYVWVTWAERDQRLFRIKLARFYRGKLRRIQVVSENQYDGIRPAITVDGTDTPWVAWEERRPTQFAIMIRRVSRWLSHEPELIDHSGELNLRVTLAGGPGRDVFVAWDHYENGAYDIRYQHRTITGPIQTAALTSDDYLDQAPSLALDPAGILWIAWHTNRPRGSGPTRSGRALFLASIRDGRLFLPEAGQPPTATALPNRPEIDDCLEFPQLLAHRSGTLFLFARRGQGFYASWLSTQGWSPMLNLSDPGWGGRGRVIRGVQGLNGNLMVIGRWLHKLAYAVLEPNPGTRGTPKMIPASKMEAKNAPRFRILVAEALTSPAPRKSLGGLTPHEGLPLDGRTDPLVSAFPSPSRRPFFGDLHTHTALSDGTGDSDEIYTRARDLLGYDFVAVTDHDVSNGNRLAPFQWDYLKLMANFFNRPGRFVTFPAYEWTSPSVALAGAGHRNIYFPSDLAPLFGVDDEAPTTVRLFDQLRSTGAITVPHHTSWTGTDWQNFDSKLQPLFEIISVHGNSERPSGRPIGPRVGKGGTYAIDGWRKGLKFGVVGGSDGHGVPWHYGVSRQEDVWTTGLTGVYAPALERAVMIGALRRRHSFATSGPPTAIWVGARGYEMGDQLPFDGSLMGARELQVAIRVRATSVLKRVDWLKDGDIVQSWLAPLGSDLEATALVEVDHQPHAYYVRVIQNDRAMAWSSPLWIGAPPKPESN